MSPGSQMRALTANKARPNSTTIAAGSRVERKNCTGNAWRDSILKGQSSLPQATSACRTG